MLDSGYQEHLHLKYQTSTRLSLKTRVVIPGNVPSLLPLSGTVLLEISAGSHIYVLNSAIFIPISGLITLHNKLS